jgi:catechol 2,3-dioxygenase-like lactoylglutathione lyase family enzyme
MSRVQLSLNVSDLDAAVAFYTRLFGTPPAKLRPGYANFAVEASPHHDTIRNQDKQARNQNHPKNARERSRTS